MNIVKKITAVVLALSVISLFGCKKDSDETTTEEVNTVNAQTTYSSTTAYSTELSSTAPATTVPVTQAPTTAAPVTAAPETQAPVTQAPVTNAPVTQAPGTDYSSWSKQQILDTLTAAVNKTKAYTGDVAVTHKESFDSNVTECTGGTLAAKACNYVIGLVMKPSQETFNFKNGKAVNSDKETIPILLPSTGSFSLPAEGVQSASIAESNNKIHVVVKLVEENCTMTDVPKYNASSIGYLDVSKLDLSFMTVTSASIDYTGSVIDAYINADGMISSVTYTISLITKGSAKAGAISGHATLEGDQVESWIFPW